ncbi:hypothetical protein [Legionella septentrionalis]|uniref:hypothetical protein n=1 Tax=Legionella septentrionalis TaxID=2498109 RepID=UPI000F8D8340|nr:hypothetical protein [Legionella septentrionalis]RUQ94614.1 hypothetical protein ELY11_10985 [Legionella septentrionalis]
MELLLNIVSVASTFSAGYAFALPLTLAKNLKQTAFTSAKKNDALIMSPIRFLPNIPVMGIFAASSAALPAISTAAINSMHLQLSFKAIPMG